jgi:hypothetical protein
VQTFKGWNYIEDIYSGRVNSVGVWKYTFTKNDSFDKLCFGHNGIQVNAKCYIPVAHLPNGTYTLSVNITNATQGNFSWKDMQIEAGTIQTEYEPYQEPITYPVNEDGTVEGVTSIYPTTTLLSDTAGVLIEAEYNADTKKYIDNKFAELAAMIVNS